MLVATGRRQPTKAPESLVEPDVAAFGRELADYLAAVERERSRRIEVIARVVNGELLIREGAELLGVSVPLVGEMKLRWEHDPGPDSLGAPRLAGRLKPKRPAPPTRARRAMYAMDTRLASPAGRSFYRQRQAIIEPSSVT